MDTETLNDYIFANLVTQWAAQIARARTPLRVATSTVSDVEVSVTTEDLREALVQLELRQGVVRALRDITSPP